MADADALHEALLVKLEALLASDRRVEAARLADTSVALGSLVTQG